MPVAPGLYRVTVDVPNPEHDKRCKYGIEGVPVVRAGSLALVHEVSITIGLTSGVWAGPGNAIYEPLAASLVGVGPSNLREYRHLHEAHDSEVVDWLNILVRDGVVTLAQVDAARRKLDDEYEIRETVRKDQQR